MSGINYIVAIGAVADEPKITSTGNGYAINFTLAVSEDIEKSSTYIKCVRFQKSNKTFFNQGDTLSVEGSLQTEKYETSDGRINYTTKVRIKSMDRVNK